MNIQFILRKYYFQLNALIVFLLFIVSTTSTASTAKVNSDLELLYKTVLGDFGQPGADSVLRWQKMLEDLSVLPNLEKVERINAFFTQTLDYEMDKSVYGKNDYWASLGETLAKSKGDCEDFAIAKYVSLRLAGISDSNLRLMYVKTKTGHSKDSIFESHVVLAYYVEQNVEPYILDSLISEVKSASQRTDLKLIYSFNKEGLWLGEQQKYYSNSQERLSSWNHVLAKIEQQGISL
ncbi:MAG: transglutaminase-like cysteine peptidase [Pseudomonadota bacterium]|nr:transglutaminase-like cysteine peptidase [Pseudomonadota bacterium]